MALEGTLRDFSLADIFQLIGLQRKTGVLTLRGKEETVAVTFLDGKVVSAEALNRRLENRIGTVLIRSGTLSPEQLSRALEIQKETLQRLGFILVQYGFISNESLSEAIQHQILQVVYRLFRWKDGDYHFSQETTIEYDRDHVTPITAESVLMEGARMIDEWPIIERKIRSYDMVFRRKTSEQEILVVGADEADEIDFGDGTVARRRKGAAPSDKIRISESEKFVYDLVDGTTSVNDIVEASRISEFDTNKALYELLTRDLIEEVRSQSPAAAEPHVDLTPIDEETPVPLPLIVLLAGWAVVAAITSFKNPLNIVSDQGLRRVAIVDARKAISFQRMQTIRDAIEGFTLANGQTPEKLEDLVPHFVSPELLKDPWGNPYKFLERPGKYLVIGFTSDGRPDTDLFLSQSLDHGTSATAGKRPTGGIILVN